ncbi:hypothetical protein [Chryseobacterium indoltheticum]|uniref:hypothetical protein n=1 Tax=Chryseobacterium indoltheticum TaxID=254 RepID=UPI003F49762E
MYETNYQFVDNKDKFQMNIVGKLKSHTGDFDEIYANNYQKALNIPLEYDLMMEGEYIYNLDSVLSEIVFHVKEKLNEKMLYVCKISYSINTINNMSQLYIAQETPLMCTSGRRLIWNRSQFSVERLS